MMPATLPVGIGEFAAEDHRLKRREAFAAAVHYEIRRLYGPVHEAHAKAAYRRPDRLDAVGVATECDLPLTPGSAVETAIRWVVWTDVRRTFWTPHTEAAR